MTARKARERKATGGGAPTCCTEVLWGVQEPSGCGYCGSCAGREGRRARLAGGQARPAMLQQTDAVLQTQAMLEALMG